MLLENDPAHVEHLRAMERQGRPAAEMLHWLADRGLEAVGVMSVLRESFGLDFDDVACIGGWSADGTGELSDEDVSRFLGAAIHDRTP